MSKLSTDIKTLSMNAMGWAERAEALEKQVKELKEREINIRTFWDVSKKAFDEIASTGTYKEHQND